MALTGPDTQTVSQTETYREEFTRIPQRFVIMTFVEQIPWKEWYWNLPYEISVMRWGFIQQYDPALSGSITKARRFTLHDALNERAKLESMYGRWTKTSNEWVTRQVVTVPTLEEIELFESIEA